MNAVQEQAKVKECSPQWMVGEQLKDICRMEPRSVELIAQDLKNEAMGDSFKKIKLVECMDLISTDVTATAEDGYSGKYPNTYDNKLLLITAIRSYFQGLEWDSLVQPGYTVDIDVEEQAKYLAGNGVDTGEMSEQKIRQTDTGTHVFLLILCKPLDAIEDIAIRVMI